MISEHQWTWIQLWRLRYNDNTLRPRQDGCRLPNDIFKCIFFNENVLILIKISLKFVPKVRINNIPALVQIMAWRGPGDKPLSEPMMVSLSTHICVTRPQWVKWDFNQNKQNFVSRYWIWGCHLRTFIHSVRTSVCYLIILIDSRVPRMDK